MAKTPRAVVIRDEEIDDASYEQDRQPVTDADNAAFEFLDKAMAEGSEAKIIIKRVLSDSTTVFCEQLPVDRYDYYGLHDYIARTYGGGEYRLYLTKKGTRGLLQNTLVKIMEKKTDTDPKTGIVMQAPRNDISLAILEELRRSNERQNQAADPMEAFAKMMPMMEFMRSMMAVQQPKNQLKEMAETLAVLREMREFSGGEEKEPSMLGMLGQALPALITAATGPKAVQPNPILKPRPQFDTAQIQRAPKPNPSPVIVPKEETPEMLKQLTPQQINEIKSYLNQACLAASFGVDPEKIAVKILESVHDEKMISIIAQTPDLVEQAAKIVPDVTKHRDWFIDLQEWVKGHLGLESKFSGEFEDDQSDDTDGEPGDGESLTE